MPILVTGSVSLFGLSAIQSGFLWSALPGIVMVLIVPLVILNRPEEIGLRSLDANEQEPALAGKQAPLKRPSRALGT
jgi:sugar phosphate permease